MPQATLTFDLPEEEREFDIALKSTGLMAVLNEMMGWLRRELKYNSAHYNEQELGVMESVQEKLFELLDDEELRSMVWGF